MKKLDINVNTSIGLPLRNLIGLISAILIGAWFAFGVIERLNKLETADTLFQADLLKKAEQEPKNLEMYMLIEHLAGQIESIEKEIEASIGLKTFIKDKNGRGKISFSYQSLDQLEGLIRKIKN